MMAAAPNTNGSKPRQINLGNLGTRMFSFFLLARPLLSNINFVYEIFSNRLLHLIVIVVIISLFYVLFVCSKSTLADIIMVIIGLCILFLLGCFIFGYYFLEKEQKTEHQQPRSSFEMTWQAWTRNGATVSKYSFLFAKKNSIHGGNAERCFDGGSFVSGQMKSSREKPEGKKLWTTKAWIYAGLLGFFLSSFVFTTVHFHCYLCKR